jgi:hypothetical protein
MVRTAPFLLDAYIQLNQIVKWISPLFQERRPVLGVVNTIQEIEGLSRLPTKRLGAKRPDKPDKFLESC